MSIQSLKSGSLLNLFLIWWGSFHPYISSKTTHHNETPVFTWCLALELNHIVVNSSHPDYMRNHVSLYILIYLPRKMAALGSGFSQNWKQRGIPSAYPHGDGSGSSTTVVSEVWWNVVYGNSLLFWGHDLGDV